MSLFEGSCSHQGSTSANGSLTGGPGATVTGVLLAGDDHWDFLANGKPAGA
jgi:hypothetical protein